MNFSVVIRISSLRCPVGLSVSDGGGSVFCGNGGENLMGGVVCFKCFW